MPRLLYSAKECLSNGCLKSVLTLGIIMLESIILFSKMSRCPCMTNVTEEGDVLLTSNDDVTLWGKLAF